MSQRQPHGVSAFVRGLSIVLASAIISNVFATALVMAWTGPSASAPNGNVAAPVNVGSTNQVKNGSLGVNSLAVFGNTLLQGNSYLNFGTTAGSGGYGIRDNSGLLEFKNSGGSWASIQNTVATLIASSSSQWVNGTGGAINYNGGNVGIGTASPSYPLTVVGNGYFSGNVYADARGMWMSEAARYNGGQFWIGVISPSYWGSCPSRSVLAGVGYYTLLCQWIY